MSIAPGQELRVSIGNGIRLVMDMALKSGEIAEISHVGIHSHQYRATGEFVVEAIEAAHGRIVIKVVERDIIPWHVFDAMDLRHILTECGDSHGLTDEAGVTIHPVQFDEDLLAKIRVRNL